ncbi:hypothetical protein E3N88_38309 [Mikania micrantha]|uniref:PGG domain-containing protein n=1 Tax=Mikania micrantha TaxID=192012 RepID=A0A5N6LW55_9ASTR|nr:hypothetical protein E3N88_38309 [Mikania micrantha]
MVVALYEASIVGDWETGKVILDKSPDFVRDIGPWKDLGTTLHMATTPDETKFTLNFIKNLVHMMNMEDLEIKNKYSNTAFWLACFSGKTKMAMIMMEKNPSLPDIRGNNELLPLSVCAVTGTHELVKFLYKYSQKTTGNHWTDKDKSLTLLHCVHRDFFDIALQILEDHPELVGNVSILEVLARKPDAFNILKKNLITRIIQSTFRFLRMKTQLVAEEDTNDALKLLKIIWGHATKKIRNDEIEDMLKRPPTFSPDGTIPNSFGILHVAAKMGNTRFIVELIRTYPDLMLLEHEDGLTIFHIAVMHRRQGKYNLLYEIGSMRKDICTFSDKSDNNMLHLVGKTSKEMAAKTCGASLLMQRELLWFKDIEKMMPPYLREAINQDGQTPYELFAKENEDLVSKGLKWMKDCMVVATLIVTVAFAVAFTVPGGYNQEYGPPIFIRKHAFLVFVIADAVSLISSSTSLLVFLSVLTSQHDQRDFMYSLPRKLIMGLLTLFISVATLMVTFSASFYVLYHNGLKWVPILMAAFAIVPVIVFAVLQFPLFVDMFRSMYDSHYLFKPKKRMLYTTKPRL